MAPLLETARRVRPGARAFVALLALLLTTVASPLMPGAEARAEARAETPAAVAADTPVETATDTATADADTVHATVRQSEPATTASNRALRAVLPILVLLVLATGLLLFELRRRRQTRPAHRMPGPSRQSLPASTATLATTEGIYESSTAHASAGGELGVVGTSSVTVVPGLVDELDPPRDPFDRDDFFEALDVPLRQEDGLDTTTAQMCCAECDRAFEMGTRFCPFDGELLHMHESETPASRSDVDADDVLMVCPRCDGEYEHDAVYCPKDQARLVARSPDDAVPDYLSAAPMVVCTHCAREFRVGQTSCPDCGDDSELRFMHGRTTRGLWVDSPPYTQICPDCGTRYSDELTHCAHDGSSLVRLN